MELKDQPNQNPENTQEEKPKAVETTEKNGDENAVSTNMKAQISPNEKQEIVDLLRGKAIAVAEDVVEIKKETAPAVVQTQLDEEDKEDILHLLRDEHETTEEEESGQISQAEKLEIIRLLGGKTKSRAVKPHKEKVDYESLNKQELVEKLEEIVEEKDILKIKDDIARIKIAFLNKNKEDVNREKKQFIADGGKEEEFKAAVGPLEHRYNSAFNHYKHNKAK